MNWKNALMNVLEAFGQTEGHWAEQGWNLPEQEKLYIKQEYEAWYNKKNKAQLHNEAERTRIEQMYGKPDVCICKESQHLVTGWICKTHGPMMPGPDLHEKQEIALRKWYTDRGAVFQSESTVLSTIYKYGGREELKDVFRFPSITMAMSCLKDLEQYHAENSYNLSGDIMVVIRDCNSVLGIIVKYNGKALIGQAERVFQFLTEDQSSNCFNELTRTHPEKCYERRNGVLLIVRAKNDESESCSLVDEPEPGLNKVKLP